MSRNSNSSEPDFSCYGEQLLYTPLSRTNFLLTGAFYIFGSLLSTSFNALFLLTMIRNRSLRKLPNYLLSCLSAVDLLTGILVMPAGAVIMIGRDYHVRYCSVELYSTSFGYSLVLTSFSMVFVITLEQYLAILQPFYHQNHVTLRKLLAPVLIMWPLFLTTCAIFTVVGGKMWLVYQNVLGCLVVVTYTVIVYCYGKIYRVARRIRRQIMATSSAQRSQVNSTSDKFRITLSRERQQRRSQHRHNKTVKTTGIIILSITLCYIPVGIYTIKRNLFHETALQRTILYEWTQLIASWTVVTNPIVYYWRLRGVRKELLKLCGKEVKETTRPSFYTSASRTTLHKKDVYTVSKAT